MATGVKPIPDGERTLTPHLVIRGAAEAMSFYEKAFGARTVCKMTCPQTGSIMHGELAFGDSKLYVCEEFPQMGGTSPVALGGTPVTLHLYVEDTDAAFERAVAAGAEVAMPPADMFWGDRFAKVTDPFGHQWTIATHKEDVSSAEMDRRLRELAGQS